MANLSKANLEGANLSLVSCEYLKPENFNRLK
jgi:uncharacterized protein YjbI with pentapeptide repeats